MIKQTLSKNIKRYRLAKGYTQLDLGELIGAPRTLVSDYETGRGAISINQVGKIADALEIKVYKLFKE